MSTQEPKDTSELDELLGITVDNGSYYFISFDGIENALIHIDTLEELKRRMYEWRNKEVIKELESFTKEAVYAEWDTSEDTTEIGDAVPAWFLYKRIDQLKSNTKEEV